MLMQCSRVRPFCGRLVPVLLLLALAPAGAAGQEVPDTLWLEDALALAWAGNPDLRIASNETERAAAMERAGWGAFLPDISASASMIDISSRTVTARNDFGQPVELEDPAEFSAAAAEGFVGASLTVFDGFQRVNELQAARAQARGADASLDGESARLEAEVRRRFYTALATDRLVAVEERLFAAAEERLGATEAMAQAGRATPQDVLGAEVEVARQEMSLEGARGNAYAAFLVLGELLGVPGEPTFQIAGELPDHDLPEGLEAGALVAVALETSPRVRRAEAMAARADHAADAARGTRWPTVRLNAGYSREVSLAEPGQLGSYPWNRGVTFGLSAALPLFNGFSTSAQVTDARVSQANAEEDLRKTRLATEREVRAGLTEVELAHRSVQLAERASELSRRRLDTGQEGFRRGLITFTELQQLIEQSAQTERTAVRARVEYAAAVATLNEVVGRDVVGAGTSEY